MPKVSVIIPVYKTEDYLRKCLDSVCNQTLKDIEIICINDCSPDGCLEILKEYASKDERIKIIDFKENKGAACARTAGIDAAQGEYIAFLDSDDYPEENNFYETLYIKAKETGADIVKGAYKDSETGYIDETINNKIKEDKNNFCSTYCSAIFDSKLIKINNIKFPLLRDMEDPVFAFKAALKANTVEIIDNCYVIIVKRSDSITSKTPSLDVLNDKIYGLKEICNMATSINNGFVIANWFSTTIQDMQKNNCQKIVTPILQELVHLFHKIKDIQNFKTRLEEIYPHLYDHFSQIYINEFFNIKSLIEKIDNAEIISFDIFDTLLLRPFIKPTDLFNYIEKYYNATGYCYERIMAEKKVRLVKSLKKNNDEVSLDEIYSKMPQEYHNYKKIEIEIETKLLQPNNEMLEIFNYARKHNKTVIITSDMYLPTSILIEILHQKGFKYFDSIYVSSEIRKTKASGEIFQHIIKDFDIAPNKILHIGDNYNSDVIMPKAFGIESFYYPKVIKRFMQVPANTRLLKFYNLTNKSLTASIILGLRILNWQNNEFKNYWESIGYNLGGILCTEFVNSSIEIAKNQNITDLLFIARDGFVLNKIYNYFATNNIQNHYVYASRKLRSLCLEESENYNTRSDFEYKKYINHLQVDDKIIGIVDSCAIVSFSAQTLLSKYLNRNNLYGIYLVSGINYKYKYFNLTNTPIEVHLKTLNWDLIELLLTSPENPIIDILNCNPVYSKENINENKRHEFFEDIFNGELAFVKDFCKIFGKNSPCLSIQEIFTYLSNFWQNIDNTDKCYLYQVPHAQDIKQEKYKPLLTQTRLKEKLNA